MSEPQIPGTLQGTPSEGNPFVPATSPGYVEGPTPGTAPYAPSGNPTVNASIPQQRPARIAGEWRW